MKNWLAGLTLCGSLITISQCNNNINSKVILSTFSDPIEKVVDNMRNNVLFTIDDGPSIYICWI